MTDAISSAAGAPDLPTPDRPLRIGTRGSPLALAQAHETRDRLMAAHGLPPEAFAITVLKTTGDKVLDRPLSEIGGKGLFTKELEAALLEDRADIAVHSMKDVGVERPDGLSLTCILPREDVRDAFISHHFKSIADLPQGAVVGSSSLRRRAQLLNRRPDLRCVEFRGNVQTRMQKLQDGVAQATFLAVAGLRRLGMDDLAAGAIETDEMLPAVAQGAIGIEHRTGDDALRALLAPLNCAETALRLEAERAFLAGLDGSCRTPIGGLAELLPGGRMRLRGEIIKPDGSIRHATEREGPVSDAAAMGADAAAELRAKGGEGFFDGMEQRP
ncbi:hydroxymethylbilane synthase [Rhodovulum sp. DZ06]|uniref:hydroxymethylbilane synthase n=1 Tax=Rhodovulum sp. DZ06 TaxID=3425126 RepID=UPI003D3357BA